MTSLTGWGRITLMHAALVLLLCLALTAPATATANQPAQAAKTQKAKIRELKRDLRDMRQSRNRWRGRARAAEAAVDSGLAEQVTIVAQRGKISELHPLVFEPIRVNWPCGSTLFQGQFSWSIDVNLEKTDVTDDGEIVETDCSG